MSDLKRTRTAVWQLHMVMAKHKIKTITEMQRRLRAVGYNISTTQLGRNVYEMPQRLCKDFLDALLTVFECDISDLITVERVADSLGEDRTGNNSGEVRERTKSSAPVDEKVAGPRAIPFSLPSRKG